ncbi:nucleolus protein [Trametes coccinea BRFM310]|uniref:25S rRNA adenine-N(1) methyltransferase n=1 Tax=Trametes coccinea (strain BRFM310) TaxID=1353009 RepID=A0A1Y2IQA5_TRAC3|nr:nucleolus protein [Trametes coccinea BRFM310]
MPKARKHKRKVPITVAGPSDRPSQPSGSSSRPQATRTVIRRFHVLIKRRTQLQQQVVAAKNRDVSAANAELDAIEREIEELGGLETYQRMSAIGQDKDRGGGSEKIFIGWLRDLQVPTSMKEKGTMLRLLEVGALKPDNYASCASWIEVTPIDLHSRHPAIQEQDFLLMNPEEHRESWDSISLSLVLNFVPDAKDRGRMLRLAHTMLRPEGLLFVALPLPCILNSRYLTPEHFQGLMAAVGFEQVYTRWREGGKMAYWLFRKVLPPASSTHKDHLPYDKKTVFRQGNRNNFVVLL